MDPEPRPKAAAPKLWNPSSKGEKKRIKILLSIQQYAEQHKDYPTLDQIQDMTGIRSFDALSRHLKDLQRDGLLETIDEPQTKFAPPKTE